MKTFQRITTTLGALSMLSIIVGAFAELGFGIDAVFKVRTLLLASILPAAFVVASCVYVAIDAWRD